MNVIFGWPIVRPCSSLTVSLWSFLCTMSPSPFYVHIFKKKKKDIVKDGLEWSSKSLSRFVSLLITTWALIRTSQQPSHIGLLYDYLGIISVSFVTQLGTSIKLHFDPRLNINGPIIRRQAEAINNEQFTSTLLTGLLHNPTTIHFVIYR